VSENPDGQFPTLFPGESWSDSWIMTADGDGLPDDLKPGERLRYQFKGNTLDWWDCETAEAHAQTVVTLPGVNTTLSPTLAYVSQIGLVPSTSRLSSHMYDSFIFR
jgi:hypothetical protein